MPVTNVPTPGSPIRSNWASSVSTVANANETLLARLTSDTGWVDLAIAAGLSGTAKYRRVGQSVWLALNLTKTGSNVSGVTVPLLTLPAAARPTVLIAGNVIVSNPASTIAPWSVATDGIATIYALTVNVNGQIQGELGWAVVLP